MKIIFNILILFYIFSISEINAQWTQIGPAGGTIASIAISGSNIFVGTSYGGLFRSTDMGSTWIETQLKYYNAGVVDAIIIDSQYIIAGSGNPAYGIHISDNNGQTWKNLLYNTFIKSLAVSGSNIFAGTLGSGVILSTDHGQTWNQTNLTVFTVYSLSINNHNIYAGTYAHGIFHSSDNGQNWDQIALNNNNLTIYSIASSGSDIFVGTDDNILYHSTNNGLNWSISLNSNPIFSIIISGQNIFAGSVINGIYKSSNNGISWNLVLLNQSIQPLALNDSIIFAGTGGTFNAQGLFKSTNNGQNWIQLSLFNNYIYSLTAFGTTVIAGTAGHDVFKTNNNGQYWKRNSFDGYDITTLGSNNSYIFLGCYNLANLYYSSDTGNTWLTTTLGGISLRSFAANNSNIFVGASHNNSSPGGVFYSSDNGSSWIQTSLNSSYGVFSLLIKDTTIFAGTHLNGIFYSFNNGINWLPTSLTTNIIWGLAKNNRFLFAASDNGIFRSSDGGLNWQNIGLEGDQVLSIAVKDSNIVAGLMVQGIYISKDNGLTWIEHNEGMVPQSITALLLTSDYAYAGTDGSSVWKRDVSDLIGIKSINTRVPVKYFLYQNYPNPFNPATKIKYQIAKSGDVRLIIYDITGKEVETLVNEKQSPGVYEVEFNGSKYASGVYFYKLETETFSETKKMVLVK